MLRVLEPSNGYPIKRSRALKELVDGLSNFRELTCLLKEEISEDEKHKLTGEAFTYCTRAQTISSPWTAHIPIKSRTQEFRDSIENNKIIICKYPI